MHTSAAIAIKPEGAWYRLGESGAASVPFGGGFHPSVAAVNGHSFSHQASRSCSKLLAIAVLEIWGFAVQAGGFLLDQNVRASVW